MTPTQEDVKTEEALLADAKNLLNPTKEGQLDIAKEGMKADPENKSTAAPEQAEQPVRLGEMLNRVDQEYTKAKKEFGLKKRIFRGLGVIFGGNEVYLDTFFDDFKKNLENFSNHPKVKKLSMNELNIILKEAQEDQYKGVLGNSKGDNNLLQPKYIPGNKVSRATEKTAVME